MMAFWKVSFLMLQLVGLGVAQDCSSRSRCPENYHFFDRFCYRVFQNTYLSWEGAQQECRNIDCTQGQGWLATINSDEEDKFVVDLWKETSSPCNGPKSRAWIGYNDMEKEGTFISSNDGSATKFTQWLNPDGGFNKQPNNLKPEQNCVNLISYYGKTGWNDDFCTEMYSFICKINAPPE